MGRRVAFGLAILAAASCGRSETVVSRQPAPPLTTSTLPPTVTVPLPPGTGPRGRILDTFGNPVAGATVNLLAGPTVQGPFTPVPSGAALLNPAMRTNPLITGPDGRYAWDALAGLYEVRVTKPGCGSEFGEPEVRSGSFRVGRNEADFDIEIDCRPPDSTPPKIVITRRPPETTTDRNLRIEFRIEDQQPGSVALCAVDDEGPSLSADGGWDPAPPEPCASPIVRTGLAPGSHQVVILAIDAHDNHSGEVITFTVR